ncbi:expressed unknown protein [Seminavis robusta]|uniref:Uncharacterized protein n=1 Tax=Seminavis robusta TaxID=568900 RepID=A0A9N8E968_9STRA|nr:expressed unknown protein [Seminavis robusta]|eukprot:Sro647_g180980.1 n/a (435) ;mRNA; f:47108-48412
MNDIKAHTSSSLQQQPSLPATLVGENTPLVEARKALHCIGNSKKSHKNQMLSFALKFYQKTQEDEMRSFNKAAEEGNFAKIISLLASQRTDEDRCRLLNHARLRSAELVVKSVSSNCSNKNMRTANHKGWYDLTPLALAAMNGHANVVEYLLRQGADPTLRGSPTENKDFNALEAAKYGVKSAQEDVDSVLTSGKEELFHFHNQQQQRHERYSSSFSSSSTGSSSHDDSTRTTISTSTALAYAQSLVEKQEQCLLCLTLLQSVVQYWPLAQGYSSHYRKRTYTNKPKDIKALRASLDAITLEGHDQNGNNNLPGSRMASNESLVNRLAGKIAAAASTEQQHVEELPQETVAPVVVRCNTLDKGGEKAATTTIAKTKKLSPTKLKTKVSSKTKTNRGRRHSDSFCIPPPPALHHRPVLARFPTLRDKNVPSLQLV